MKTPSSIAGRATGGLLILALFLTACSGRGNDKAAPARSDSTVAVTASTTVPTTANPQADVAAVVEATYREATAAQIQYMSETGPFAPDAFKDRVGRFLTGAQYAISFKEAQRRRLLGEVFDPPGLQAGEIAPVVTITGSDRATIRDCQADHATVKAATHQRLDQPVQGRELLVADMVLENGQWKIADSTAKGESCSV
jgi:hypothetical protein